jgi:hypothetical protein
MKERGFVVLFGIIFLCFVSIVSSAELKVTEEHPFYLDGEWVSAKDLKPGDEFKTIDGKRAVVKSVRLVVPENPFWVYNLEVPLYNNFVVGPDGIIVHNSNRPTFKPEVNPNTFEGRRIVSPDGEGTFLGSRNGVARILKADESGNLAVHEYPLSSLKPYSEHSTVKHAIGEIKNVYDELPESFSGQDFARFKEEMKDIIDPNQELDLYLHELDSKLRTLDWYGDGSRNFGKTATILKYNIRGPQSEYAYHGTSTIFMDSLKKNGIDNRLGGTTNFGAMVEGSPTTYAGDIDYVRSYAKTTSNSRGGESMLLRWKVNEWSGVNGDKIPIIEVKGSKEVVPSSILEYSTDNGKTWGKLIHGGSDSK